MLRRDMERYVALQRVSGFVFDEQARVLESYVTFAASEGDIFVRTARVLAWSRRAASAQRRRTLLLTVRRFALALTAEDPRHEVPSSDLLPRAKRARQQPYIYNAAEIEALVNCAGDAATRGCRVAGLYPTLFGLLAATGMRISEVLALDMGDITADGILIRQAKRKGRRLLPLHPTTSRALERYLTARRDVDAGCDAVFLADRGGRLSYGAVLGVFKRMLEKTGLTHAAKGGRHPRIHDLRHSFAVRSLEACGPDRRVIARHMVGLSTYLGHVRISDTYWYLEATPFLLQQIAERGEALLERGAP
jgi:integrase